MRWYNYVAFFLMLATGSTSMADSIINWGNNANTGNIVIDGNVITSGGDILRGSGKKQSQDREVANFNKIEVSSALDVIYQQGTATSVQISGDDNIIPLVQTNVSNGVLSLNINKSYTNSMPLLVKLNSPDLQSITISGSSDVRLNAIRSNQFAIKVTGTGDLLAEGQVKELNISLLGSGDANVKNLIADSVIAKLHGSGDLNLTARENLSAELIGSGDIVYYGNPKTINKQIVGSGDFNAGD